MNEITNNEILFWKFYRNKYIRMVLYQNLSSMKLSFTSFDEIYLGNRVPFKFIRSLSWLSKRFAWSLLKDKLISNQELVIKKSGIYRFLKNCKKDVYLIKLLYSKHTEEMNQVDLVLLSIQTNNMVALELFFLEYKIPTTIHSIDMAYEIGAVGIFETIGKTFDFKITSKYTTDLFRSLKVNKFSTVQYILSRPIEYCLGDGMIEIATFHRYEERTRMIILNFKQFNLLKIDGYRTLSAIQSYLSPYYVYSLPEQDRYQPFILPNSTYQLLYKFYTHLDLFKLPIDYNVLNGCYLLTLINNFGKSNDISELQAYISVAPIAFLKTIHKFKQLNLNVLPMLVNQEIINLFKESRIKLDLVQLCNGNDGTSTIGPIKGFESKLKSIAFRQLPKQIEILSFEFNGYPYRNNLKEIVRKGEFKELIALLDQGYGIDFTISDPLMSKILKYVDLETIKQLSPWFKCYGYSFSKNSIPTNMFQRIIDRGRTDVYLYFLSLLGVENYNCKLDSQIISRLTFKGDIEMIKFLFQLNFNYNNNKNNSTGDSTDNAINTIKVEENRKTILNETYLNAIKSSNIKLVKWLLSTDNIFKGYIDRLSFTDSLLTIEISGRSYQKQFYISIPFSNYYKTFIK